MNNAKCKIAGICVKKGVKMAFYGMKCIDLTDDIIKILDLFKKNFLNHIVKTQNILKLWKLRNLTIKLRIVVFKSLAISKIIHLAVVTEVPTSTIN